MNLDDTQQLSYQSDNECFVRYKLIKTDNGMSGPLRQEYIEVDEDSIEIEYPIWFMGMEWSKWFLFYTLGENAAKCIEQLIIDEALKEI